MYYVSSSSGKKEKKNDENNEKIQENGKLAQAGFLVFENGRVLHELQRNYSRFSYFFSCKSQPDFLIIIVRFLGIYIYI